MHWRYCVRKCQKISAEKWLIPTQIISSVHFGFLLVYSWTYGGRASTTETVLISWCLSCCSAALILPGATISVSPLPRSRPWERKSGCLQGPTLWIHRRDSGPEFRGSAALPHAPPPSHKLDFHPWLSCLDLLEECILRLDYARRPINWYVEVHFTSKWQASHEWPFLWFPSWKWFLTSSWSLWVGVESHALWGAPSVHCGVVCRMLHLSKPLSISWIHELKNKY